MGMIEWQCCGCYHIFKAHDNKCPSCGHLINWSHQHRGIQRPRQHKPNLLQRIGKRMWSYLYS